MKMKKIVSAVLAGLMTASLALSFTGCSSSKKPEGTIGIGAIGPTTGDAAIYGVAVKNGVEIAVEEINALGGLQFSLNFQDDVHDAEKSVNAYNTLKDWGMQVLVGSVTTTPCLAVASEANTDHIFELTPSASSTDVLGGFADASGSVTIARRDNVFQMCFTDPNQGTAAAEYINEQHLGEKIAVIYNSSDVYSKGIYEKFVTKAAELGMNIVSTTSFTNDTATDFTVQIGDAKANDADLIFLPIYYTPASLIFKQADSMGYTPKYFGVDGMDGILGLEGFDTSLAEGLMMLTPFAADAKDEKTVSFVTKYQEKFGGVPNQFAADAYDGIYALAAACEKAGVTADTSVEDACDMIIAAMQEIQVEGLTGTMTWDAAGTVTKTPTAVVIKDGAYVSAE